MRKISVLVFLLGVGLALVFGSSSLGANHREPQIVGVLLASDVRTPRLNGIKDGLRRYGFVEGKDIQYIVENAQQDPEVLPQLANSLVEAKADVIVAAGESEALAAKEATAASKTPVVFVGVGFPVELTLVASYASTGNNITGLDNNYLQLSGKRLEYFQRLLPELRKIAVLYDPRVSPAKITLTYLDKISKQLSLQIQPIPVGNREEVVNTIRNLNRNEVDGVMLLCSLLLESITDAIEPIAMEKGLPVMGLSEDQTEKGLLASYGMPYYQQGIQAARLVAKVLRGQEPNTIPVEPPTNVQFVVNLDTARKLGLELDQQGLACVNRFVGRAGSGKP